MSTNKSGAKHLCAVFKEKGVQDIVICPGSRNAPLIIEFTADPFFNCYSIVDERSASFFALGMSQVTQRPTAIVCTSGSALLNIAPGVAEAYYQRLPLIVVSADRPNEWINQGESQTMNQREIYKNYVKASFDLVQEPRDEDELWFQDRQIAEAIDQSQYPYFGPVHLNIHFREPLYEQNTEKTTTSSNLKTLSVSPHLTEHDFEELKKKWRSASRIMILCGQLFPDEGLNRTLSTLAENGVVVLTESTSNLNHPSFISCIDKVIIPFGEDHREALMPELLITIGGPLISRKVKNFLRDNKNLKHWHVDPATPVVDSVKQQEYGIQMNPADFLKAFEGMKQASVEFSEAWIGFKNQTEAQHAKYLEKASMSDLKAFDLVLHNIPSDAMLQIGNSASVRYVQLFDLCRGNLNFSNRGTSGIEGSLSTAVGASVKHNKDVYVVLGDLSTFYDSNALWNEYLEPNLKIVVLNNGGGGIFRIIPGPKTVENFERFIETRHEGSLEKLANLYGLNYFLVSDVNAFSEQWKLFTESEQPAMIELRTKEIESDQELKEYFEFLKLEHE